MSFVKVRSAAKTHIVLDIELPTEYHDCMDDICHHDPTPSGEIYYTLEEAANLVRDLQKAIGEAYDHRDVAKQMKPNRKKGGRR